MDGALVKSPLPRAVAIVTCSAVVAKCEIYSQCLRALRTAQLIPRTVSIIKLVFQLFFIDFKETVLS